MGPIGTQSVRSNAAGREPYHGPSNYQAYGVAYRNNYSTVSCIHTPVITSTPNKSNDQDDDQPLDLRIRINDTPTKPTQLQTGRKSLLKEMKWEENTTSEEHAKTKHPMEMRSRKCLKLSQYYDYQEYSDFGEDLSFLFDEELPDLEFRPRRNKSRKKRSMTNMKRSLPHARSEKKDPIPQKPTSPRSQPSHANNPTSISDDFSTIRPNQKATRISPNLTCCNNCDTSEPNAGTCPKNPVKDAVDNDKHSIDGYASNFAKNFKRRMSQPDAASDFPRKRARRLSIGNDAHGNTFAPSNRLRRRRASVLEVMPNLNKGDGKKSEKSNKLTHVIQTLDLNKRHRRKNFESDPKIGADTVPRMTLRRRHSSPLLDGFWEGSTGKGTPVKIEKLYQTLSSSVRGDRRAEHCEKAAITTPSEISLDPNDSFSCDDVSDSEQFVDSPDSGFGSESSCSAASPGGEPLNGFFYSPSKSADAKSDVDCDITKDLISRTESTDSRIQVSCDILSHHSDETQANQSEETEEREGLRLNLCQESVKEAQRLLEEARKREEEESLRQKYQCLWVDCASPFDSRSVSDLHQHLQTCHVKKTKSEEYCCKWKGCKMFEKVSRKLAWIQRHVGEHSGEKPYKCILDGCDASFSSLCGLKRHVEAHYSEVTLPKARVGGEHGSYPRFLLNSRRVRDKRKTLANRHDCMDNRTLNFIKHSLVQNEITTATDADGNSKEVVFKAKIVARRSEEDGSKSVLVKWEPANMLPNQWLPERDFNPEKRVQRFWLPWRAKSSMKKLFFFGRSTSDRKSVAARRMSLFGSLF